MLRKVQSPYTEPGRNRKYNKHNQKLKLWWKNLLGCPGGSAGKESACKTGDLGSIPGLGRPPGEGKGYPLQYCGLENPKSTGSQRLLTVSSSHCFPLRHSRPLSSFWHLISPCCLWSPTITTHTQTSGYHELLSSRTPFPCSFPQVSKKQILDRFQVATRLCISWPESAQPFVCLPWLTF